MATNRTIAAGLILFGVLSATDFAQTYALIEVSGGDVYEANPVAAAWLEQGGWTGLALFKAASVAVVVGVMVLLAAHSRRAAAAVTAGCCLVVLAVALHSRSLLADLKMPGEGLPVWGRLGRQFAHHRHLPSLPPVVGADETDQPSTPRPGSEPLRPPGFDVATREAQSR